MKDDTIYVVSSFHRSGSAMMMRCLEAGGLHPVVDEGADEILNIKSTDKNYEPNPNGFYQTDLGKFLDADLNTKKEYEGNVIKCYVQDLINLPDAKYKIVFMKRNPKEIAASMTAMFDGDWGLEKSILSNYEGYLNTVVLALQARGITDINFLEYAEVVANPLQAFETLQKAGFPIDPVASSAMVQPELYRLKLENL